MSKLRAPIRELLDDRLPEPEVQRMWRRLQRRSARRRLVWPSALPLMAAASLVLLGVAGWLGLRGANSSGALAIDGADALSPSRVLVSDADTAWPLSDGSRIQLASASRLEVLENNEHAFKLRLEAGRGAFEVKPGGPRRWSIECGELSVEVVGTSFMVDRDARGVRVEVRHGVVQVRSARIAGGLRRLKAGEQMYVGSDSPAEPMQGKAATAVALPPLEQKPMAEPEQAPRETTVESAQPSAADAHSKPTAAVRTSEDAELAGLLKRADRARRSGQVARAEALLDRVRVGWPGTPHAAIASLTLARMRIELAPERAATDLEAALAAELPQGLREDATARLVEAYARAGQAESAERAAEAYRRAFPKGRRAAEVARWMQPQ